LKEKNDLLEKIFNNNIDLVALADLEGNFILVGKSHEILGYDIEYLIGCSGVFWPKTKKYPRGICGH